MNITAKSSANRIACIWDFDKTLIPGYMQKPLFEKYNIDEKIFWNEVRALPKIYRERGTYVSEEIMHLNHLLTYVKNGPLRGLNNKILRELGAELELYPGLPDFFERTKELLRAKEAYRQHEIKIEHYIISSGLAEMIRGSAIAQYVDGIYACEFIEDPLLPNFNAQKEIKLSKESKEISQIGRIIDNTIKTRFLFEINKGSNKNRDIDVNTYMPSASRRIPIENMIYIADGPTDVPMFVVIRDHGGKAFAVHSTDSMDEFIQNDDLLHGNRIDCYGPADYREGSHTYKWLTMNIKRIADTIVSKREQALRDSIIQSPKHDVEDQKESYPAEQASLFDKSF